MRWVLVCVVVLSGCLQNRVPTCDDGTVCPAGTTCDVDNHRCLTDEQIEACATLDDGDGCELIGVPQSVCVDGACEPVGCGDGVVNLPEQCDPAVEVDATCTSLGFHVTDGPVGCYDDCTYDTSNCSETCGDGIRTDPEECEAGDLQGMDCTDFGYYQTAGLACTTFCRYDVSQCSETCGDGDLNGPEVCEGDVAPAGQTCLDYGFDTGLLGCNAGTCTADFGVCEYLGWRLRPVGVPTLNAVYGANRDDIWAVGPSGSIVHFDGDEWTDETATVGETADLWSIWGAAANDIWAVGAAGRVLHWNGTAWSGSNHGSANLRSVWGTAANDVWAVGNTGTVLHWNGSAWSPAPAPPTSTDLRGVWGTPGDIWVVGPSVVLRWNGTSWKTFMSGAFDFSAVWGTGPDSVTFAAVNSEPSYHWDGASITQQQIGGAYAFAASGTRATNTVFGGDAFIYHDDGVEMAFGELPVPRAVFGFWSFADGTIVGVGAEGTALHWDAHVGWTDQLFDPTVSLRDVWMASPYHGYAVSITGEIHELREGGRWAFVWDTAENLNCVGGSASDDVWVGGNAHIFHYGGGTTWTSTNTTQSIWGVWSASATDAFAVGLGGTILHWNGATWSPMSSGTTAPLLAVWGTSGSDVFAVGTGGRILHYDGSTWSAMASGTSTAVFRGVHGSGPDDVWAVGQDGVVRHWNGSAWTGNAPGVDESFYRVLGFAPDDVLIAGSGGRLYHWDGAVWTPIRAASQYEIIGMSGWAQSIYLAGGGGGNTMLRLIRPEVCAAAETSCEDGMDEDCDGARDCDDSECSGAVECAGAGPCAPGTVLACGASVGGTSTGAGNDITDYGCSQYPATGPDVGYRFTSPTERDVTVTVVPGGQHVFDLSILSAAASGACAPSDHCEGAAQPTSGNASLTFRAYPGITYYFVVDGYAGETGNFTISVACL